MAPLKEGDVAPLFELPDDEGRPFRLAEAIGKSNIVLYFYPMDDTPGCRVEALCFRDEIAQFKGLDATVIGVSKGSVESKAAFKEKYQLNFALLADADGRVTQAYGAAGWFGRAPKRATFIIGKDGRIRRIYANPLPKPHVSLARQTLEKIAQEERGAGGGAVRA